MHRVVTALVAAPLSAALIWSAEACPAPRQPGHCNCVVKRAFSHGGLKNPCNGTRCGAAVRDCVAATYAGKRWVPWSD
jgi:hypothetical protein